MKKLIAILLSVTILCSAAATADFSAFAFYDESGKCGANVSFSYKSATRTLTLSGSGPMYDYTNEEDSPFYLANGVEKIVINYGVTTIGRSAFFGCYNMVDISIASSVTSIGICAFQSCRSLERISLPNSVTSIGGAAFYNCDKLQEINLGNQLKSIGDIAFAYCYNLKTIVFPVSVKSIDKNAFFCSVTEGVFYKGSEAAWQQVSVHSESGLEGKPIHYNSSGEHSWDGGSVAGDHCTTSSYIVYKCTVCGKTKTGASVPPTGHNFGNNAEYCLNGCGTENPNYVAPAPSDTINPSTAIAESKSGFVDAGSDVRFDESSGRIAARALGIKVNKTALTSAKSPKKKTITISWQKAKKVTGYVVQVSTGKKFKKGTKTYIARSTSKNAKISKGIKGKKKYYIRIRTFKTVNYNGRDVTVYGKWSKAKAVKTKG